MSRLVGLGGALLLLAGGLGVVAASLRARSRQGVQRLRAVLDDPDARAGEDTSALAALWTQLARSAEEAGKGTSLFAALESRLDRAGWLLRPGEFLLLVVGTAVGGALAGGLLLDSAGVPLGAIAGVAVPSMLMVRRGQQLIRRVEAQLPDVLGQLSASMRSGLSLGQAIDAVASEGNEPMASQLSRVLAETRVGVPLDEALGHMADRVGSTDLRWAVRAMAIQANTGGKLSDILDVLAEFMRDREEVRREVRALTAEGKISAAVLIALPFFVAGAILVMSPDYLLPMFRDPRGLVLVGGATVMMALAVVWIRNIIRIEV